MKRVLCLISIAALFVTLAVPFLALAGMMDLAAMKTALLLATLVWLGAAPFWMGADKGGEGE